MKKIFVLVLAFFTLFNVTACGEKEDVISNNEIYSESDAEKLFDKVIDAMGQLPSMTDIDEEVFKSLYGAEDKDIEKVFSKIPLMNVIATEVSLVVFKNEISLDEAKEFFKFRLDQLELIWGIYLPEQYKLVQDVKICVKGNLALFVIAEKSKEAKEAFLK